LQTASKIIVMEEVFYYRSRFNVIWLYITIIIIR